MDLALNNLQWLICLKTQQTKPNIPFKTYRSFKGTNDLPLKEKIGIFSALLATRVGQFGNPSFVTGFGFFLDNAVFDLVFLLSKDTVHFFM